MGVVGCFYARGYSGQWRGVWSAVWVWDRDGTDSGGTRDAVLCRSGLPLLLLLCKYYSTVRAAASRPASIAALDRRVFPSAAYAALGG